MGLKSRPEITWEDPPPVSRGFGTSANGMVKGMDLLMEVIPMVLGNPNRWLVLTTVDKAEPMPGIFGSQPQRTKHIMNLKPQIWTESQAEQIEMTTRTDDYGIRKVWVRYAQS